MCVSTDASWAILFCSGMILQKKDIKWKFIPLSWFSDSDSPASIPTVDPPDKKKIKHKDHKKMEPHCAYPGNQRNPDFVN